MVPTERASAIGVLASGGLDSAVLLAQLADDYRPVYPIYIRSGLVWEEAEIAHLQQFIQALRKPSIAPLVHLDMPAADLYGDHWSVTAKEVPDADSPDEAVYLPGRNLLLLLKAMLWCHQTGVRRLALGILRGNPFPDASGRFLFRFQDVVREGCGAAVAIERPFATWSKADVIAEGRGLPLQWTFSCIRPDDGRHCGCCNKCAERRRAFEASGVDDPTAYASQEGCPASCRPATFDQRSDR